MHLNTAIKLSLLCLIGSILWQADGAKIVLFPFPWKSHVFQITAIGRALRSRGHEISIVLPPSYPDRDGILKTQFELIEYEIKEKDFYGMDSEELDTMNQEMALMPPIQEFREHIDGFVQFCSNPLSDKKLFQELQKKSFDLAIVDAFPGSRCYMILLYRLGMPYVSLTTHYEPWLLRNPALPSFLPFHFAQYFTERMTYLERVQNLLTILDWTVYPRVEYIEDGFVAKYLPDRPFLSLNQLAQRSLLWLVDSDVAVDYPRPNMPNEINIGGLSTGPARPLTSDLQSLLDQAKDGAVLVSFGSTTILPQQYSDKLLEAFKESKYHVLWRYTGTDSPRDIPERIRLLDWVPQNDALGHPNLKLFITHCGANSQYEAVYHAVPMIGFPLFAEQAYNARRMAYREYGIYLDIDSFQPSELVEAMDSVVGNETYYKNIKRASEIFRSRPMKPVERSVYWVEHVLQYGGKHLHSYALDLEWYEYLMLDMLAPVLVVIFLTGACFGSCLGSLCCRKQSRKEKIQ